MERTLISHLSSTIGNFIKVQGWVNGVRNQKRIQFVILRDHTGLAQATYERLGENDKLAQIISSLTEESVVEITGKVIRNSIVRLNQIEIIIESLNLVSKAESLPININKANLDARLDWRFLDLRQPKNHLIFEVQTTIEQVMRSFWQKNDFIEIHSPKLMESASESGSEVFRVEYFGRYAYLAQSPQFYKQMAMAAGFDRVFEIGPVFRANPSFTSRHDTEFTSVDVEISWIESHQDVMQLEERWLQYILQVVKEKHGEQIAKTFNVELNVPKLPFPQITMAKAYQILEEMGYAVPRSEKGDLDPEGERLLAKYVFMNLNHEFVFITDYPTTVRPFYHMRYEDNPTITKSFDLVWRGLEVTTGAQREHRYDILLKQAEEKDLVLEPIQYYLNFFKYGCPPHGGFGFGLTRMLMILLGFKSVREVTYLYRGPSRLSP